LFSIGAVNDRSTQQDRSIKSNGKELHSRTCFRRKVWNKKEFSSRYTDKGLQCEDEAISLVNDVLGLGFIFKNEEHFNNDWITGTPDVNTNEILLDIKCSYEAHTFPFFETEIPNKDYFFQLQGYMWLNRIKTKRCCVIV
jgi:hypothetical protein